MRWSLLSLILAGVALIPAFLSSQEKEGVKLNDAETQILELTNAARKEKELPPLVVSATLMKAARAHTENMAKQDKLAHTLDDKTPFDRLRDAGYRFGQAGENVAYGDEAFSVKQIFQGWMDSEGHRKNILSSGFSEIGLGASTSGEKRYYTQVFGHPLK